MTIDNFICPKCGCREYSSRECGPDSYDDDITYTSEICKECGLYHDGWSGHWYPKGTGWRETEWVEPWMKREEYDNLIGSKSLNTCNCDKPKDIYHVGNGFFCGLCNRLIQTIGRR